MDENCPVAEMELREAFNTFKILQRRNQRSAPYTTGTRRCSAVMTCANTRCVMLDPGSGPRMTGVAKMSGAQTQQASFRRKPESRAAHAFAPHKGPLSGSRRIRNLPETCPKPARNLTEF